MRSLAFLTHGEPGAVADALDEGDDPTAAELRGALINALRHIAQLERTPEFGISALERGAAPEAPPDLGSHFCAGPYCPGLGWPASNTPHPTSCALERLNSNSHLRDTARRRLSYGHGITFTVPPAEAAAAEPSLGPAPVYDLFVIYKWLRDDHKQSDLKPANLEWRSLLLLQDFDRRLRLLETR